MKLTILFYRLGNWCYNYKIPLYFITDYMTRYICGCWFPAKISAGKKLRLGYGGLGVVVHHNTVIGSNVTISQNVTIGRNFGDKMVPIIGNDVYIGKGALIFGEISIGNNVIIGGNTVVNKSIPDNSTVVGNPFKIIQSNRMEKYYELDKIFEKSL